MTGRSASAPGPQQETPLEAALGHAFRDRTLLEMALTHASLAQERDGTRGNERLEFLGDAVLDLVISRGLFEAHPGWTEGQLTRTRAALVNARSLADRARQIALGPHVRLGRSELRSAGQEKRSILANVFEALIAALYLDGGLPVAEGFIRRSFPEAFDPEARASQRDPKTRLNEWAVARYGTPPRYESLVDHGEAAGPERFEIDALVGEDVAGHGSGPTRRDAERAAASRALEALAAVEEPAEPGP